MPCLEQYRMPGFQPNADHYNNLVAFSAMIGRMDSLRILLGSYGKHLNAIVIPDAITELEQSLHMWEMV